MHYNPFAYVHSEKDILKLVTTLMTNTKGEGSGGDPFWEKSERLLLTALIAYLHYEAPVEEQNFATLLEMLNTIDTLMLPPCLVPSYRHRPMMNSHRAFFIYRRILNEQYRNQHRHLPDCQKADRQDNLYRACAFQPDRQGDDGGQNQASAA